MPRAGTYAKRREALAAVLDLSASGLSISTVASRLGLRVSYVARLLTEATAALPGQDADELRIVTEVRLDRLAERLLPLIDSDDERTRLQAVAQLRQVEADRSRLLGLWQRPEQPEPSNR